jgi:hypothetical protein
MSVSSEKGLGSREPIDVAEGVLGSRQQRRQQSSHVDELRPIGRRTEQACFPRLSDRYLSQIDGWRRIGAKAFEITDRGRAMLCARHRQCIVVGHLFVLPRIDQLADTDMRGDDVRMFVRQPETERASPRLQHRVVRVLTANVTASARRVMFQAAARLEPPC